MHHEGRAPLDRGRDDAVARRPAAYAAIQRRAGETVGAKEMTMTRRARAEDGSLRTRRFVGLARLPEAH
ncbi:MAG: hypothetical protein ACK4WC_09875 [Rubrimonas sp.]